MNSKCAFCDQLVERFIRCDECDEAICADHRTLTPIGPRPAYAGTGEGTPLRYLCPRHVGLLKQELAAGRSAAHDFSLAGRPTAAAHQ